MATEIIRPNAAGDETNITTQYPNSTYHWDKVDEAVADDDSTYLQKLESGTLRDLYNLPASSGQVVITKINVYMRCKEILDPQSGGYEEGRAWTVIKTGGTAYEGSVIALETTYTLYNTEYTTNPQSGVAWTWADIDALQIGVKLEGGDIPEPPMGPDGARCTQVYVEVTYTPYSDSNVRYRRGGVTYKLAARAAPTGSDEIQIRRGGATVALPLVDVGDASASYVRVRVGGATKALVKYI